MKYWLLVYFFEPSGDFLWKDVIPVESVESCQEVSTRLSGIFINSGTATSYFCVAEDELETRARDIELYEKDLRVSEKVIYGDVEEDI